MIDAGTGWTDNRVALLSKLWLDGLSASQIAAALGGGVTRNAVIGKVHRLGLSGRGKAGQTVPQRAARPRPPSPDGEAPRQNEAGPPPSDASRIPAIAPAPRPETAPVFLPVSERVSIHELRDTMCRWPIGDPSSSDFGFCGARSVTGLPYCGHHCSIAYQPAAERRRIRA